MVDWMDKGWVLSRKEKVLGRRGGPSRFVWTGGGGVDVCFPQGRGVGSVPGGSFTLWQGLWRRVPEGFEQAVERVPRVRPPMNGGEGESMRAEARPPPEVSADLLNRGASLGVACPGAVDVGVAEYEAKRVRFACARCWNVQHTPSNPGAAWNQLVTAISGGLLYGREVQRPTGFGDEGV